MGQAMKGYSLVSVLAALIILMAVLVPLLSLQGRLLEYTQKDALNRAFRLIEEDVALLSRESGRPGSEEISQAPPIYRNVQGKSARLWALRYEITLGGNKEVIHYWISRDSI